MGIHYKPTKSLLDDAGRVDLDADMTQELNYAPPPTGGNNGAADDAAGDVAGADDAAGDGDATCPIPGDGDEVDLLNENDCLD